MPRKVSAMENDSAVDQRHLRRMKDAIEAYFAKRMDLGHLVNNLEGLLGSLESIPKEWRDEFLHQWGKLEDVLAVAADRGNSRLIAENEKMITETLSRLLTMIETQRLGRPDWEGESE